jgi:predicted TPR repeat methyltransferase
MGRYEEAAQAFEAGEREAEIELRASIAALQEKGSFDVTHLEHYAHEVACTLADDASDEVLKLINDEILHVVFDRRMVDPEILVEDPEGAYIVQIMMAFADHLEQHLLRVLDADRPSFVAAGLGETRRSRLSPLAAQD